MVRVRLVDGTSKDAPGVGGVVAVEIALAMHVQHDRRGRGTPHRRRGHPVEDEEAGRARKMPLVAGAKLASGRGRSGAEEGHDL